MRERECDRNRNKSRDHGHKADSGRPREKDWHSDHTTGHDHSVAIKRGWSDEFGNPLENCHSKER